MAFTLADFRAEFPEFQPLEDGYIQRFLTRTEAFLDPSAWGLCFDQAVLLYTAHRIATRQAGLLATTTVNGAVVTSAAPGVISSASADGVSSSFALPEYATGRDGGDTELAKTPYGQEYIALRTQCISRISLAGSRTRYRQYFSPNFVQENNQG